MITNYNGRATFDNLSNGTKITIPIKNNYFSIITTVLFLSLLLFVGFLLIYFFDLVIENSINGLFVVAMIGLIISILPMLFLLLWNLFGTETILVQANRLSLKKNLLGFEISHHDYLKGQLKNFRYKDLNYAKNPYKSILYPYGLGGGNVQFDYGVKTFEFGFELDEAEAHHIIEIIDGEMKL